MSGRCEERLVHHSNETRVDDDHLLRKAEGGREGQQHPAGGLVKGGGGVGVEEVKTW